MKINIGQKEIIHFIGMGGIGMSGLAQIMKIMGFKVQGSDISTNKNIENCKTGHMDRPNKPQRIISVSRTDGASQKDEEYQKWKEGK